MRMKDVVSENSTTVVLEVIKRLRNEILNGNLKNGERLVQDEWANKLEVSRMPIREALTQLEMEGLVKLIPHKGAIVTSITKEDIEEIFIIRSIVEGLVVQQSLPYLTSEDKEELGSILNEMEQLKLSDETNDPYVQLNASFHEVLHRGCPWSRAKKIVDNLGITPIAPKLLIDYYTGTQQDHRRIYEAVMKDDAIELKVAMEYHILRTKNNLLEVIDRLNQGKDDS